MQLVCCAINMDQRDRRHAAAGPMLSWCGKWRCAFDHDCIVTNEIDENESLKISTTHKLFPIDINELAATVTLIIFPSTNILVTNVGPRISTLLVNAQ